MSFVQTATTVVPLSVKVAAADEWRGFVYPDRNDLTVSAKMGTFDSFDLCKSSSLDVLKAFGHDRIGAYECGLDCKPPTSERGLWVCKDTRDE